MSVVYHGAPVATFDLDICCPFEEENVRRIESAVRDLNPVHRMTPNKVPLEMTRNQFANFRNLCLQTDLGKLDCLGEIAAVGDFEAVLKQSVVAKFSYGEFRMLNLNALIASKTALGRDKDLEAVRLLCAIKEKTKQ
ncbi:MAG TPA: nucleotidyltransferase [Verrucomicrobiae bacterium]|nr:nucleotidyltransferase [Verrucomicrobiae bacterium]